MQVTKTMVLEEIHLAATQGFCAGVASAIEVVDRALHKYGHPLFVRHEIVHNTAVIEDFEKKGVVFIENLSDVPENQVVIFSAHGTAPEEYVKAKQRGLHIIDATCPLVSKIHRQAVRFSERGIQTVLIGHKGHQELIGTSGYVDQALLHIIETVEDVDSLELDSERPVGFLTQTTLSVSDTQSIIGRLKLKYPDIIGPPKADICYATTNRQNSVRDIAALCDVIIVCGSPTSSNSNRLREMSESLGVASYIIDTVDELDFSWFENKRRCGITSGASVPKKIVDDLVHVLQSRFTNIKIFQDDNIETGIHFPLPNL
ncbi:4-hydroxy-3-methylbut-2-enyl diphosphate reductase [Candidatus Marinamargulisbacteria bacterium SCGC AG-333-B06]|nr:4-hydroxy-3-methylbut-2-enyl diphosphate reductase [Candidatus Marinamargulisbacteria bacterium SCGC AG-333-B06]